MEDKISPKYMMVLWEKRLTDFKGKFKPLRMWSLNRGRRGMSTRTKQQTFFHIVKSGTEIAVHMKDVPTIMADVQNMTFCLMQKGSVCNGSLNVSVFNVSL